MDFLYFLSSAIQGFYLDRHAQLSLNYIDWSRQTVCSPTVPSSPYIYTQTGLMIKDRFIGQNIRLLCDVLEQTELKNIPGILVQLDFNFVKPLTQSSDQ